MEHFAHSALCAPAHLCPDRAHDADAIQAVRGTGGRSHSRAAQARQLFRRRSQCARDEAVRRVRVFLPARAGAAGGSVCDRPQNGKEKLPSHPFIEYDKIRGLVRRPRPHDRGNDARQYHSRRVCRGIPVPEHDVLQLRSTVWTAERRCGRESRTDRGLHFFPRYAGEDIRPGEGGFCKGHSCRQRIVLVSRHRSESGG